MSLIENLLPITQIIFADIILSGDNALVIGMAAATLPLQLRKKAIFLGMALAAGLRIFFAVIATFLLQVPVIIFFGGLLLAVVCWRFFQDLRNQEAKKVGDASGLKGHAGSSRQTLWRALFTITFADVSMSIDNVAAVSAIARDDTALLVFGLALAVLLMALCATYIMKILTRFPFLSWLGLLFLIYLTFKMLYDGWPAFAELIMVTGSS
ncbi:MAG: YjbE family putative metal transport protein [Alphaproteobacteria bacterium]|nr:YjbE family putative metal transport protein [Alphaproteobacteria bacterium]HJO87361.1 YjbE family putative metal transport protein [Rhodospirillales bacterium]